MTLWERFGNILNSSFYYILDKILDMLGYFMGQAYAFGRLVLLIAIFTAALNYALTGAGLKENLIKIMKATLFFFIVMALYPRIIGWISGYTFELAKGSIYDSVEKHFKGVDTLVSTQSIEVPTTIRPYDQVNFASQSTYVYQTLTVTRTTEVLRDNSHLFSDILDKRTHLNPSTKKPDMVYYVVAPAAVLKILFFIASECFDYADENNVDKSWLPSIPPFGRILKGLICAGIIIFTGVFALFEYLICFMEFMFVASVGIILFPMAIWEGTKFLSESFVKAIIGFFMKLLFCNLAIFLLIYGFISLFYIIAGKTEGTAAAGFTGSVEEIIFIVFTCVLFYLLCKSAPSIAGSLLSGTPSLTAAGAIGAVSGAVAAAGAIASAPGAIKSKIAGAAGSIVGGVAKIAGGLTEAGAAAKEAKAERGTLGNQAGAFMASLGKQASQGLARSIYGNKSEDKQTGETRTMGQMKGLRQSAGAETGKQHMAKT